MLSENIRENHFHPSAQSALPIGKSALPNNNNNSPHHEVDHTPPRSNTSSPPADIKNRDVSPPPPDVNTLDERDAEVKKEANSSDCSVGEKEVDAIAKESNEGF